MGDYDRSFNAPTLADTEHGPVVLGGTDVAFDISVDVKAARELDVAMDSRFGPDQGTDGRLTSTFST
jgi:hypothetical protein